MLPSHGRWCNTGVVTVRLRFRGEEVEVPVLDLEEDVRAGRVPSVAEVQYGPWTGPDWRRIGEIPELAEALDAPAARLSAQLRTGPVPWVSAVVTLVILASGLLQGFSSLFGLSLGGAGLALRDFFLTSLTGLDSLIFEGRWTTSFRSQLTHGGAGHLFPNLAVIGYAGFRVEKALGVGGYAVVAVASVVLGTVAIALIETVPVLGSSVLGYGLWASMLTVGLRLDDQLPPSDRRFYGFGAILLFLFLLAGSIGQEGVSHTGHAFGFVGGALATFALRPETLVPRSGRRSQLRRNLVLAGVLSAVPAVASATLYRFPTVLLGEAAEVSVDGWTLSIPVQMAERTASIGGARGWTTSENSREGVFAGVRDLGETVPETLEVLWGRRSDGPLEVLPAPESLGEGWTAWRARLTRADGRPLAEVVEHRRREGHTLWRLGSLVQVGHDDAVGRRAPTFEAIIGSAVPRETEAVRKARSAVEAGGGPRSRLAWAQQLHQVGKLAEADALLAELASSPRFAADAAKARFALWAYHPEQVPPDAVEQVQALLVGQAGDWRLMSTGVHWLVERGACAPAWVAHTALQESWGDAQAWVRLDTQVRAACPR